MNQEISAIQTTHNVNCTEGNYMLEGFYIINSSTGITNAYIKASVQEGDSTLYAGEVSVLNNVVSIVAEKTGIVQETLKMLVNLFCRIKEESAAADNE